MSTPTTVVVTGSGSGIGRATAARYLRDGCLVYGMDRSETQTHPLDGQGSGTWRPLRTDVADPGSVHEAFEVAKGTGPIDILVLSAGIGYPEPFARMELDSWDRVFGVNVTGTMLCIKEALPGMLEERAGSIVVVSSIAGRTKSVANGAHYTTSKYALMGLTRHLAAELAGSGVRINCVAPGPTDSPILTSHTSQADIDAIVARTPLRRLADPDDIAGVIVFAADSARASQIHGAILDVNGGLY